MNREQILYDVIEAVSALGVEEMLQRVDRIVAEITDADSTGIYTLDEQSQSVILRASKLHFAIAGELKMELGEGITGWVAEHGEAVILDKNAPQDPRFARVHNLPDDLYEGFLSVPIKSGEVIVGVINVKHEKPHEYPQETVKLLEMVGKLVGRAIEHAVLLEETESLRKALETQKLVGRAKGLLMEKEGLSENAAYHLLRKQAMKERKSLAEIAEAVITAAEVNS